MIQDKEDICYLTKGDFFTNQSMMELFTTLNSVKVSDLVYNVEVINYSQIITIACVLGVNLIIYIIVLTAKNKANKASLVPEETENIVIRPFMIIFAIE